MQYRSISSKTLVLPLALLSLAVISSAQANWFRIPEANFNRSVGSAPSPKPKDIRGTQVESDYPVLSQALNEQGKVGLKIMLTEQGTMTDVVVEQSSGFPRLDEAAVRYMKANWQYQPADKDTPMPASVQAAVMFKLQ